MNAEQKDRALAERIENATGHRQSWADQFARTLRRAQLTLHRWAEEICNGTIQREGPDGDGQPFRVYQFSTAPHTFGSLQKTPTADREAGALRRVEAVCKAAGLHYYHQTDPRGCALYVAAEPLTDQNYSTKGVPCL